MAADVPCPANPIHELLAYVRAMRAMMAMMGAVFGAPVTGGAWPGGKGGVGACGVAGGGITVRF